MGYLPHKVIDPVLCGVMSAFLRVGRISRNMMELPNIYPWYPKAAIDLTLANYRRKYDVEDPRLEVVVGKAW